ncbi:MAG: aldehyde ferredoxin oxidoreductase C-terminal domain-containing protein [Promethearchaeota archaeon]
MVVTYIVKGEGGGTWQLVMKDADFKFLEGAEVSPVTATVIYRDVESFFKLVTGEMSGVRGYASGAIKFEGPANVLVSLGKVFSSKRAKKGKKEKKDKKGTGTFERNAQGAFDFMTSVFSKEEALKMKKDVVVTYIVEGEGGGTWQLVMKDADFKFLEGAEVSPVTATVIYRDVESFFKLVTGEMSGVRGYASGAIKFEGPANVLVSLGKVFSSKAAKKDMKKEKKAAKKAKKAKKEAKPIPKLEGLGGYMGKILRVDLTNETINEEKLDEKKLKLYVGGTGLGVKMLYDETTPDIQWDDPENRLIYVTGPFSGTAAPGSGLYGVATRGPLTNMFVCSHSNGHFGAKLKFSGYDGIVFQGAAKRWVYLYINDGVAELRDAGHLLGKDIWETEDAIAEELGNPKIGVSAIGPAGEKLVKYACIGNDKGHVCSTNGCGAVMGTKKLKAVAVYGKQKVPIYDRETFKELVKIWWEEAYESMWGYLIPSLGTNGQQASCFEGGFLPVKNLTTNVFPNYRTFNGAEMREYYQGKPRPCYACRFNHIHTIELKSGPHKDTIVEEAEFEGTGAFSIQIGNDDLDASQWLNHVNDKLGMDAKEQAWVLGLAIECYEKGLLTKEDTDGLELTWGNIEAVEALMRKIAAREGIGDLLAEGVYRAAQKIGGEAPNMAVYTHLGNGPHVHDGRGMWSIMFSMAVSDMGSIPAGDMGDVGDLLDESEADALDPDQAFSGDLVAYGQAITGRRGHFIDCLGICMFIAGIPFTTVAKMLNTITGWNYTWKDCAEVGERVMNMMRAYNVKRGLNREHNYPSPRLRSAPVDGPVKGKSIEPEFDKMLDIYYETLGWDKDGKPLPETLKRLGLQKIAEDLGL